MSQSIEDPKPTLRAPHIGVPAVGRHGPGLPLRIGTRASPLALVQTRLFQEMLGRFCPVLRGMNVFEELAIRTTGDASQASGVRLAELGGKGLFAKEIHEALLAGRISFAVHSAKDLDTFLPPGIVLACTLPRADPRDALVLGPDALPIDALPIDDGEDPYAALPHGAVIGSSSVRRQAQLLHARPDLQVRTIRGNVQTRLDKVRGGAYAGSFLARAGLLRLGLADEADIILDPAIMVPSACQGIIAITVQERDEELRELLAAITDETSHLQALAERAILAALDGSCLTPIGAHAECRPDGQIRLTGLVAREDGTFLLRRSLDCTPIDATRAGTELGQSLRRDSPADLFH